MSRDQHNIGTSSGDFAIIQHKQIPWIRILEILLV